MLINIQNYSNNIRNQYFAKNQKRNLVAFKGFSDYENEDLNKTKSYFDTVGKFHARLNEINEKYKKAKAGIRGFFKRRKIKKIEEAYALEMNGFIAAQDLFIKQQAEFIRVNCERLKEIESGNASVEEIIELRNSIAQMQRINEKTQLIANSKSQDEGFNSIGGYDYEKNILTEKFINQLPIEMSGLEADLPNAILFFGPYGNGKTSFATAFAKSAACNFVDIQGRGETKEIRQEDFMNKLMSAAQEAEETFQKTGIRTIILADEFDGYANEDSVILPELKNFMQSCSEDYHCTLFCTTNHPSLIASPILGPSRMPLKVSIEPPDRNNIIAVFRHYLKNIATVDINYDQIADKMLEKAGNRAYNNSQIEEICNDCFLDIDDITTKDLIEEIEGSEPGLSEEILQKFEEDKKRFTPETEEI